MRRIQIAVMLVVSLSAVSCMTTQEQVSTRKNSQTITVYLEGGITRTGGYTLPEGSTYGAAVDAAGGLSAPGDMDGTPVSVTVIHPGKKKHILFENSPRWRDTVLRGGDILQFQKVPW
jgi:protein involved in polysaccharide export with SLBB domain